MPKTHPIPEGAQDRLRQLLHETQNPAEIKRIQCVFCRVTYNHSVDTIADLTGYHPVYVRSIQALYFRQGEEALRVKPRGGRHHQHLSVLEEKEVLAPFLTAASKGELVEVGPIQRAYEQKVGREVPPSTLYRLLHRHRWREVVPRPKHPKQDPAAVDTFKKTSVMP
jgi:transposase